MNSKGFTLIELIVTIALLSIIAMISFVSVNAVIKSNKIDQCNNLISSIEAATKEFVSDRRYDSEFIDGSVDSSKMEAYITGTELVSENYLTSPIINPITKKEIPPSSISITVYLNNDYSAKSIKEIRGITCE